MAGKDDSGDFNQIIERLLTRLQSDESLHQVSIVKMSADGWYSRNYLSQRLPAEIARSHVTGRPFSLGLFRYRDASEETFADWKGQLCARLSPVEVGIALDDETLIVLYPEKDRGSADIRHLFVAAEAEDLPDWDTIFSAVLCYQPKGEQPEDLTAVSERLLRQIEEKVVPLSSVSVEQDEEDRVAAQFAAAEQPAPVAAAEDAPAPDASATPQDDPEPTGAPGDEEALTLVAVGFSPGRRLPVSVWYDGELQLIEAVLNEAEPQPGTRRLEVKTVEDVMTLIEQEGRWYVKS